MALSRNILVSIANESKNDGRFELHADGYNDGPLVDVIICCFHLLDIFSIKNSAVNHRK